MRHTAGEHSPDVGQSGIRWMTGLWFPVHLGFCPNRDSWDRYMRKVGVDSSIAGYPTNDDAREGHFSSFEDNRAKRHYDPFGLITISKQMDTADPNAVVGMLVHESVHAFQFVVKRMGEQYPSAEFEAYGIQYIFGFMNRCYGEQRWHQKAKKKLHGRKNRKADR